MSIVGHAEPLDYDIYARDDYYFGYSNPEFKALIAALDDSVDARGAQGPAAADSAQARHRCRQWLLVPISAAGYLECARARHRLRQCARCRGCHARLFRRCRASAPRRTAASRNAPAVIADCRRPFFGGSADLVVLSVRRFGSAYLAERAAVLLATLLAATAIVFVVVQVVPGDPVRYMMGLQADPDTVAAMRHQLGLDAGPWQRYGAGSAACCMAISARATPIASR